MKNDFFLCFGITTVFLDSQVEELGFRALFVLFASFFGILFILAGLLILGFRRREPTRKGSPYSSEPMILGEDIARSLVYMVEDFMQTQQQPENAPFDISRAAICRGTGRIFPEAIGRSGISSVDWGFIQKRYPGAYVSWGALSEEEQARIRLMQDGDLEGFQTQDSSKRLLPRDVEDYYKTIAPGPLYVDRMKGTLVGWKEVPGTHFEVLIVQKPKFQSIEETL